MLKINVFRKLAPWPVDWINPAEAIARHCRSLLTPIDPDAERANLVSADHVWFTSQNPDFSTRRLMHGFGLEMF